MCLKLSIGFYLKAYSSYLIILFSLNFSGLPLIFVVIGLGTVLDEYGVRDSEGKLL